MMQNTYLHKDQLAFLVYRNMYHNKNMSDYVSYSEHSIDTVDGFPSFSGNDLTVW